MATAVEAPSRADRDHFTEVYRLHSPGIRAFVGQRLVWRDEQLAEDITAEAFTEYWRSFVLRGRHGDTQVFNLLATIARRRAWKHFNDTRSVADMAVDFTDQATRTIDALGATGLDTSSDPEQLARALDDALDVMNAKGKAWRRTRQVVCGIKAGTASARSRLGAAHVVQFEASIAERLATAQDAEQAALDEFLTARAEVARLRDQLHPH